MIIPRDFNHLMSRPIVITEIEQFGGAERSVLGLARWLYEKGLPAHVVTYKDHCGLAQYASHPLSVIELEPRAGTVRRIRSLQSYFSIRSSNAPKPLLSGYQPALHATLAGVRAFHTLMHDTPSLFECDFHPGYGDRFRGFVSNRIVGRGLATAGHTLVNSDFLKKECARIFHVDAAIVRMGGKPRSSSTPALAGVATMKSSFKLLSVSRIEENKRLDWIIRSLGELEHHQPALSSLVKWSLDIVGTGPLIAQLRRLAQERGVGDRMHFHGFVSDAFLERLYSDADLFLMPAVQGYGLPALEALQRGVPVLLHRDSGVSDILMNTPWANVITGGEESLVTAIWDAVMSVRSGKLSNVPLLEIPTEDGWANEIATLCNWT